MYVAWPADGPAGLAGGAEYVGKEAECEVAGAVAVVAAVEACG